MSLLEKYKCSTEPAFPKNYIDRPRYETMLLGLLPFADQELYFDSLSASSAMILVGAQGNGKRTLEAAFARNFGGKLSAFLKFPFDEFARSGEKELCKEIKAFFSKFSTEIKEDVENPGEPPLKEAEITNEQATEEESSQDIDPSEQQTETEAEINDDDGEIDESDAYLISLGDITAAAKFPSAARLLAECINAVIKNGKCLCLLTGVFDGTVREVPACIGKAVRICRVDPPSRDERLKFFDAAIHPLLGYINDTTGIDFMADYSEGFSFTDLEELMKDLHIFLKAKFIVDAAESAGTEIDEVEMSDIGIDKVELVKDDFIYLADTYKPEKPQSAAVDMSGISELIAALSAKNEEEEKPGPVSPFALIDDDDDPDLM